MQSLLHDSVLSGHQDDNLLTVKLVHTDGYAWNDWIG